MNTRDWKYILAYIIPLSAWFGLEKGGFWSLGSFYVAFIALPFLELFFPQYKENVTQNDEEERTNIKFFDLLLWLNVPILYGLVWLLLQRVHQGAMSNVEIAMSILNVGVVAGACGINVAHELGHRANRFEQTLAKMLLLPNLYMHFFIEHNLGHHKHVATDADPASARLGENVYAFWWRSVSGSWRSAWQIAAQQLKKNEQSFFSISNEMLIFQAIQVIYLAIIGFYFSLTTMLTAIAVAIVGFLLLETINYIEHYGLRRKLLASGRYEPVQPHHSWNSNHEIGRIVLYELTRHADHHFKATRKYQILRHFDESPQLPLGYPGSMWLSLIPPLWFKVMNKKLQTV
jgi:alkane 1-monooxygenase